MPSNTTKATPRSENPLLQSPPKPPCETPKITDLASVDYSAVLSKCSAFLASKDPLTVMQLQDLLSLLSFALSTADSDVATFGTKTFRIVDYSPRLPDAVSKKLAEVFRNVSSTLLDDFTGENIRKLVETEKKALSSAVPTFQYHLVLPVLFQVAPPAQLHEIISSYRSSLLVNPAVSQSLLWVLTQVQSKSSTGWFSTKGKVTESAMKDIVNIFSPLLMPSHFLTGPAPIITLPSEFAYVKTESVPTSALSNINDVLENILKSEAPSGTLEVDPFSIVSLILAIATKRAEFSTSSKEISSLVTKLVVQGQLGVRGGFSALMKLSFEMMDGWCRKLYSCDEDQFIRQSGISEVHVFRFAIF